MSYSVGMSNLEALVLELLMGAGREMYGLELVEASNRMLKKGTVYVTLGRMEKKGFIESRKEKQRAGARGLPRRLYTPTGVGEELYELNRAAQALAGGALTYG